MKDQTPEAILKLSRGFMEIRILLTGAEMNIFSLLGKASMTAKEISLQLGANLRALTILLDALTAMGLLCKKKDAYISNPAIVPFLSDDHPKTILPMVLHSAHLWKTWSRLTDVIKRTEEPAPKMADPFGGLDELRAFIGAMHAIAEPMAEKIVTVVNPLSARSLLDVGGASGTYTLAFLRKVPGMRATLFDRPAVIDMARQRFGDTGMLDRVTLVPGDFDHDELPEGHDLAFVSAIIHQNSLDQNIDLFQKVFRALEPGGRIIIRDHVMNKERIRPQNGAIFAVNMLMMTRSGGTYTYEEIRTCLLKAGFHAIQLIRKGKHMDAIIEAFKP